MFRFYSIQGSKPQNIDNTHNSWLRLQDSDYSPGNDWKEYVMFFRVIVKYVSIMLLILFYIPVSLEWIS